jgi:aryl-alcohol dehydrogenase-like predicted oxidoreductase
MTINESPVRLGSSDITTAPLAFGTWGWDAAARRNAGGRYSDTDLQTAFQTSVAQGLTLCDTAESYGNGEVESRVGRLLKETAQPIHVATKFPPWRNRWRKSHLLDSLKRSLERLQRDRIDLYQTHFHFRFVPLVIWMSALADAQKQGLVRAVGTSNYDANRLVKAHSLLARRGVAMATTQFQYSLLHRTPEKNGLLARCKELSITPLAYSPLGMGLLSGRTQAPGASHFSSNSSGQIPDAKALAELVGLMKEIGQSHQRKTVSQMGLNWVICKGAIPIHGAKSGDQAAENAGALGWRLTADEVQQLDASSEGLTPDQKS